MDSRDILVRPICRRFSVLVFYRYSESPYELVDIDLNRDARGDECDMPFSSSSVLLLTSQLGSRIGSPNYGDVHLMTQDGHVLSAHKVVLEDRWRWFKSICTGERAETFYVQGGKRVPGIRKPSTPFDIITMSPDGRVVIQFCSLTRSLLLYILEFLYTGSVPTVKQGIGRRRSRKSCRRSSVYDDRSQSETESSSHSASGGDIDDFVDDMEDDVDQEDAGSNSNGFHGMQDPQGTQLTQDRSREEPEVTGLDEEDSLDGAKRVFQRLSVGSSDERNASCPSGPFNTPITVSIGSQLYPYTVANMYNLPRLGHLLERFFRANLTLNNAVATLRFASTNNAKGLLNYCEDFFARYIEWFTWKYSNLESRLGSEVYQRILSLAKPDASPDLCIPGRTGHACCGSGQYIFCLGGYNLKGTQALGAIPVFNTTSYNWSLLPTYGQAPHTLVFHSSVMIGSKIISFGGGLHLQNLDTVHILDVDTMMWSQPQILGRSPPARKRHTATAINDSIWIFGGRARNHVLSDLYTLHVPTLSWQKPQTWGTRPLPRYGHTATYVPKLNCIVVIGGFTVAGMRADVYSLDIETLRWTPQRSNARRQDEPAPRLCHSALLITHENVDYIAVFGGNSQGQAYLNDLWLLNLQDWSWSQPTTSGDCPSRRFTHSSFLLPSADGSSDKFAIWAGADRELFPTDLTEFDMSTMKWNKIETAVYGRTPEPYLFVRQPAFVNEMRQAFIHSRYGRKDVSTSENDESQQDSSQDDGSTGDSASIQTPVEHSRLLDMDPDFSDPYVTFVVEGKSIRASKFMLAARSEHMQTMLESSMLEGTGQQIELHGIRFSTFVAMLHFLYCGDLPALGDQRAQQQTVFASPSQGPHSPSDFGRRISCSSGPSSAIGSPVGGSSEALSGSSSVPSLNLDEITPGCSPRSKLGRMASTQSRSLLGAPRQAWTSTSTPSFSSTLTTINDASTTIDSSTSSMAATEVPESMDDDHVVSTCDCQACLLSGSPIKLDFDVKNCHFMLNCTSIQDSTPRESTDSPSQSTPHHLRDSTSVLPLPTVVSPTLTAMNQAEHIVVNALELLVVADRFGFDSLCVTIEASLGKQITFGISLFPLCLSFSGLVFMLSKFPRCRISYTFYALCR